MKIAGLQRVTLIDYPDRIAATVFIAGCNLNCGFCHNRWMIDEGDVAETMSPQSFLKWLSGRIGKLDGVCITGGEPLLAPDLAALVDGIKELGFAVKLDTNGLFPDRLEALLGRDMLDYVAVDIKSPLDARYRLAAGVAVDLTRLRRSMSILRHSRVLWEFRTTVHPLLDMAALEDIARCLNPGDTWVLQPFVPAESVLAEVRAQAFLTVEQLEALLPVLRQHVPSVRVRSG
ncbi:MAG: anaerobic ribonucleoside-triphosphate reductase activating protein [Anaerolineae bacterium]